MHKEKKKLSYSLRENKTPKTKGKKEEATET
jgi:hypothetical protein